MSELDLKVEAQLRAMTPFELRQRLLDVNITLAAIRKGKKRGMGNPKVYHKVKMEKKMIQQIQAERERRSSESENKKVS